MKKLTTLFIVLLASLSTWGVKVNPEPAIITQADGTQLTVIGYGDEDAHWFTTTDGVLLAHVGYNYYVASINADGLLMPTKQLAHEKSLRSEAEKQLVAAQDRQLFIEKVAARRQAARQQRIGIGTMTPAYFPHTGSPKAMVILVQFADTTFSVTDPVVSFNEYLNNEGPLPDRGLRENRNTGSVRQYFADMSQGLYTPQFDVFGPVTTKKGWAYYGENPTAGSHDMGSRIQELVKEACAAIDDTVDFSQYDANNDGYVDLVYVIYAGYGENTSGNSSYCIWPKSGLLSGGTYDGKSVSRYGLHCELNYTPKKKLSEAPWKRINGIGLFCHEFSHTLGLPDMYPNTKAAQSVDNQTMEYWDLMDGGEYTDNSYTPTPYTPWERQVMEWTDIEELSDTAQVTLNHDEFVRISSETNDEYVILQNIQNEGWYSKVLGGHGMLIYRVDYGKSSVNLSDYPNSTARKPGMTLVPADGLLINYYRVYAADSLKSDQKPYSMAEYQDSHYGDPFPGTSGVTELLSMKLNGCTLEKPLFNIKEENGVITFDYLKDSTLGIDLNAIENVGLTDRRIFTLDGRLVSTDGKQLPKGVYIQNHQKFVVK